MNGFNDGEACFYANIAKRTLGYYEENNPEFVLRKEELRRSQHLAAKRNIAESLKNKNTPISQWFLERRDEDYKPQQKIEHSGLIQTDNSALSPGILAATEEYHKKLRAELEKEIKENAHKDSKPA
jgi:hypothetical protein